MRLWRSRADKRIDALLERVAKLEDAAYLNIPGSATFHATKVSEVTEAILGHLGLKVERIYPRAAGVKLEKK